METQGTLKQMWDTRPPRIPEDQGGKAVVGGVCEGIGARYQVDPVFVRVLFAVLSLAFGGGIFLYLLCWINMPRFGMTRSPWSAVVTPGEKLTKVEKKERDTGWWLLLGMLIFFPSMSVAGDARAVLVTFILFAAGWYFAHQHQPEPPVGLLAGTPEPSLHDATGTPPLDTSHLTPPEGYPHPGAGLKPPAWDPLGAAPDLWHLPEPVEPAPAPEKSKTRGWIWLPIALLVALPLAAAATTSGGHFEVRFGPVGSADLKFNDVESIPDYQALVGETRIDLSDLEPLEEPKTLEFNNGVGELDVVLPNNVPVEVNCKVNIGETACPQGKQNADKEGEMLTLYVSQRVGSVSAYFEE
mgnify:FL=1